MTDDTLRELLAKATAGEWFNAYNVILSNHRDTTFDVIASFVNEENAEANIALACAAVNELPALLADRAELAALREAVSALAEKWRKESKAGDQSATAEQQDVGYQMGLEGCADDLEALLPASVRGEVEGG